MEMHQLRYFVAVAEEGSFSRAAERMHVAQPSLSQQMQNVQTPEPFFRAKARLKKNCRVSDSPFGRFIGANSDGFFD
jgi:hypothetical protein